jgi:thymidylate synthase
MELLGPVYGKQLRDFNGVDQLQYILKQIKETTKLKAHYGKLMESQ